MLVKFKSGRHVYFLISGRYITEAEVVAVSSWFVTIKSTKKYTLKCTFPSTLNQCQNNIRKSP